MTIKMTEDYQQHWSTLQRILEDTAILSVEDAKIILKLMHDIKNGLVK